MKRDLEYEAETGNSDGKANDGMDKTEISNKLQQVYKRLEFIDADSAESRAASILAVSFKSHPIVTSSVSCMPN